MGFGSYDESEQQNQDQDDEEDAEAVTVHETDHQGDVTFESEASTDELVDRLADMKSDDE